MLLRICSVLGSAPESLPCQAANAQETWPQVSSCSGVQGVELDGDVDFDELARMTEGYSGDDLTNVCRDAAMNGMRRKILGKSPEEIRQAVPLSEPIASTNVAVARPFDVSVAPLQSHEQRGCPRASPDG